MNKKSLESVLGDQLSTFGFKKKGSTWYCHREGSLQVVDLQKSSYGMQFFVNLSCVPAGMEIEGMPTPKENKCPIRVRLTSVFPEQKEDIEKVFDLEFSSISELDRIAQVCRIVNDLIFPFMACMNDASSIRQAIEQHIIKVAWINLAAQRHLGVLASNPT